MTKLKIEVYNNTYPYPSLTFNYPVGLGSSSPDYNDYPVDYENFKELFKDGVDPEEVLDNISNLLFTNHGDPDWLTHEELQFENSLPFTQYEVDNIINTLKPFMRD